MLRLAKHGCCISAAPPLPPYFSLDQPSFCFLRSLRYFYYNLVEDRLPFGLEKGFQITAILEDDEEDWWSGKVGHLLEQEFQWRRRHKDMAVVQFTMRDWVTWVVDIKGLPGVRLVKKDGQDRIEFVSTGGLGGRRGGKSNPFFPADHSHVG